MLHTILQVAKLDCDVQASGTVQYLWLLLFAVASTSALHLLATLVTAQLSLSAAAILRSSDKLKLSM